MATQAVRTAPATRIELVMSTIRARIAGRRLAVGSKLPSVRSLAKTLQVSVSTVVEAYGRLAAEGAIVSRRGSGFYVADQIAPMALSAVGPRLDRAIDPLWVSRQSLESDDGTPKPGCGWLPPSWFPDPILRRALRGLARGGAGALDYGSPLACRRSGSLSADGWASAGLSPPRPDRADRKRHPGDRPAVPPAARAGRHGAGGRPCYFNFQALLRAHRAEVIGVPYMAAGPDVDAFAAILSERRPRVYITNSAVHNPTGATLSPVVAHRVLRLADQHGLTIVEDDIFADFEHAPAPRLAGFDGLDRVIQIGSFSKTLSAAARCGFIAARPDWIDGLIDLKIATAFGGGRLNEELVYAALSDGGYRKHVEMLRVRLEHARREVGFRLRSMGVAPWIEPKAGMFLWCRLPDGCDSAELARTALASELVLAPGNAFSTSGSAGRYMRFNVAQMQDERTFDFLKTSLSPR